MEKININIDTDVFLPAYQYLVESRYDQNLLWGGRDSGKSHFIAQKMILDCLSSTYFRCVLIKKTYESIKDSQYQTLKEIISDWGMEDLFVFRLNPLEIICTNGNMFMARGCDNPQKLKSIRNPSHAWYEEGDQLSEQDFITASSTLRGPNGVKVQEWISFNPECQGNYKDHWIYKTYFKAHHQKMYTDFSSSITIILPLTGKKHTITYSSTHTTYQDNIFCPPERQAKLEAYKLNNPYYYKVYCLGEWGMKEVTSPFLFTFKHDKHVARVEYMEGEITYLSFDFNRNPICCSVWQIKGDEQIRCPAVIKLPRSDIYKLCQVIKYRYKDALYIVTGDSTGLNSSAMVKDDLNYYSIIQEQLELNDSQIQLMANPSIVENQTHCNKVFAHYDIVMDEEEAAPLIFDCQFAEIRADGKLKKENREDPTQQLDALDTMRYFLNRFVD